MIVKVTKHGTTCDSFVLLFYYLRSFPDPFCDLNVIAAMDTSVTSVLHQSMFLNFLPRKKNQCYADTCLMANKVIV